MLSQILVEHTLRNMQTVDLVLETVIDRSSGVVADHDPEFHAWMERHIEALPFVRALYIVGADGFIVHDTDYPTTPRISLADRPYFAFHKNNPRSGLHVGQPLLSRSIGRWFVSVTRRVETPSGAFGGVAVAAVEPDFYHRVYGELPLDPRDSIALWHADGLLIAVAPEDFGLVGQSLPNSRLFKEHLPTRNSGTFILEDPSYAEGPQAVGYRT